MYPRFYVICAICSLKKVGHNICYVVNYSLMGRVFVDMHLSLLYKRYADLNAFTNYKQINK